MNQARKLSLAVCTALGIGMTAPALADDQTNSAPQYMSVESQGSDSAAAAQQVTVIVTEPSLVFSDGAWYTYADGAWQQFDGSQWQNLAQTSYYTTDSDESLAASDEATGDDYASLGADEIWFVWVPMSNEQPQLGVAESDADAMSTPYYNVELSNVNDIPVYSQENGQWYVLVPMASDEVSSVAYLY